MSIRCSEDAAKAVRSAFPKRSFGLQECFVVLCLDAHNQPLGRPVMVAMGTINGVTVHPRDVFRSAIRKNAVAVIVAHNHPSGKTELSDDDLALTRRLKEAGEMLGIPLLDHLVLSKDGYASTADRGVM